MKVSVSIVTYCHENYIGPCLDSVIEQALTCDWEIIVADDGSSDGTPEVLRRYQALHPQLIRLILHPHNVGWQENYNTAINACQGDYIAHIDGDDLMLPGKLNSQIQILDSHPDIAIVCHDMAVFDSDSNEDLGRYNERGMKELNTLADLVREGNLFCHSAKMYRKKSIPAAGFNRETKTFLDYVHSLQTCADGDIFYIDRVLGRYRKHSSSYSTANLERVDASLSDFEICFRIAREIGVDEQDIEFGRSRVLYMFSLICLGNGWPDKGRTLLAATRDLPKYNFKHRVLAGLSFGTWPIWIAGYLFGGLSQLLTLLRRTKSAVGR